ncbi:MAG: adenosine deaminase [Candidatus Eremiobacteraeota bacterium]|nr:adenosine deaminase [Candidatus Eremiobacteraeota bacterium]
MSIAARIPKVHLHCHLEGSVRPQTFVELAAKHGVGLRYGDGTPDADPAQPYRFKDFAEFLLAFAAVGRALGEPADYARIAREFVEEALAQNVIYGELFISPSVWTFFHEEFDVREGVEAIVTELRRARPSAEFKLIVDLTRNFGAESALRTAKLAASLVDLDVIGVGLGGDEVRFGPELFVEPFAYAKAQGLACVAHAGEAAGHASVRDAVNLLGARRIGHGVAALQDATTLELLARNGVALEICPTSNTFTGTALAGRHAFAEFDRAGCVVTIDADDPHMFGTTITREYELVETVAGPAALERYVRNAIDASFADATVKAALHARMSSF